MIQFVGVSKSYPDGTIVLENLSFEVEEGRMLLITGPSGSGKTTIMRLLIGEVPPDQGEIIFDQQPLAKLRGKQLYLHRRQIGVVFQDYKLVEEMNVWENIALPLMIKGEKQSVIEEKVTDLLKLVELADKALCFPRQLSGGEAQRISIARALANSPKLIFADEPTGNLDEANSQRVLKLLTKINQLGTTLLLATHDPIIINSLQTQRVELIKNKPDVENLYSQSNSSGDSKITQTNNKSALSPSIDSHETNPTQRNNTTSDKPTQSEAQPIESNVQPKTSKRAEKSTEDSASLSAKSSKKTRVGGFWARFARPSKNSKPQSSSSSTIVELIEESLVDDLFEDQPISRVETRSTKKSSKKESSHKKSQSDSASKKSS